MLVYYEYDLKLMQIFTFGRNTFKDHSRNQRNFLAGNQKCLLRYLLIVVIIVLILYSKWQMETNSICKISYE